MRRRDSYPGGSSLFGPRNLRAYFRHFRRKKVWKVRPGGRNPTNLADPESNQAPDPREPDAWLVFEDEFSGVGAASLQNHSGDDDDADDQADELRRYRACGSSEAVARPSM